LNPTLAALVSRSAEVDWQGRALGLMQSAGSLARVVGPVLAGVLLEINFLSPGVGFAFLVLVAASGVVFLALGVLFKFGRRLVMRDSVGGGN